MGDEAEKEGTLKFSCQQWGLVLLCVIGCGAQSAAIAAGPPGGRATPVAVEEAKIRALAPVNWVTGSVISRYDARIAAEVAGRLESVSDVGEHLRAGEVLAHIDDVLIKADKAAAEAEVLREKANLKFLGREVERLQRLAKQNNAAQTQLDQTLAERDATQGDLAAAEARLLVVNERLTRAAMKAPFDGVVVKRFKREGEWVGSGDEVLHLVAADQLEIEANAPIASKPFLQPGAEVTIKTGEKMGKAVIRSLVPVADETSRLLALRLDITQGDWLAGEPVRVALPSAHEQDVLSVSRDALVLRRGSVSLFSVNEAGMAERHEVELGVAMGEFIEVRGDINAGDKVVIRGNERLRPGQEVQVVDGK